MFTLACMTIQYSAQLLDQPFMGFPFSSELMTYIAALTSCDFCLLSLVHTKNKFIQVSTNYFTLIKKILKHTGANLVNDNELFSFSLVNRQALTLIQL